jgi:hypothetical protein
MRRKHARKQQPLTLETLEPRLLLASDVTVSFRGDDLVIRGDGDDNQVEISQPAAGTLRIEGRDETTINGEDFMEWVGVQNGLWIRLNQGGEDEVFVKGPFHWPNDVDVRMNQGAFFLDGTLEAVEIDGDLSVRSHGDVSLLNAVKVYGETSIDAGGEIGIAAGFAHVVDFASAEFDDSLNIDNPYFPLVPGTTYTYEEESIDDETGEVETEVVVVEVLPDTRVILGVESRVVRDTVFLEGLVVEDTFDWYAQDNDGNVWYMGEDSTSYEYDDEGNLIGISKEGSWEGGIDEALPGIQMQADPQVGDRYYQEVAQRVALDQAEVLATDETATAPVGMFDDVLRVKETTVLELGAWEDKLYAPGLGQILAFGYDLYSGEVVATARLLSVEVSGAGVTELVDAEGFDGTNASGSASGGAVFGDDATIRTSGWVVILGTTFEDDIHIDSKEAVALIESVFEGELHVRANDVLSFRDVWAEDDVTVCGDLDVYVFESTFLEEVAILLGHSDNSLVISGSVFDELSADGGPGENEFEDGGDNVFNELELTRFNGD